MNIIGWKTTYIGSWWYVRVYIFLVCVFPFVNCIFKRRGKEWLDVAKNILLCFCIFALLWIHHIGGTLNDICFKIANPVYFAIYLVGYLCANIGEVGIPEGLYALIKKYSFFLALLCFFFFYAVRIYVADSAGYNIVDIIIIAPWIYSFTILLRKAPHIRKFLAWWGKYSIYMWLVHEFFRTYFTSFLFLTDYSVVIYLTLISLSLALSIVLSKIEQVVDRLIQLICKLKKERA